MKKDVIYIDVEDDITAIIGKVKASNEKVIALVPPKRIGVLQSAVNLRLLDRAAKHDGKQLAVVTNNTALTALAAAASIPVAKNLQSKPELADIPALEVNGEDVIDGANLPVGDHAKLGENTSEADAMADVLASSSATPASVAPKTKPTRAVPAKKIKVPNFDTFRKKLFLGIGAGVLLIAFLVWAFVIAPRATVIISAKTASSSVNKVVNIATKTTTSFAKSSLLATAVEQSENESVEFTATGKKDAGTKASGDVTFKNNSFDSVSIPAGTKLRSDEGLVFTVDDTVNVPGGSSGQCPLCPGSAGEASGSVTAAEPGSKYNAATGELDGAPSNVSAEFDGPTSGGVSKMITIVSQADVDKAKESFAAEGNDDMKNVLKKKFKDNVIVIDESFVVDKGNPVSSPAVGSEASDGKATLKGEVTYRMWGVERDEVSSFLDGYMKDELKDADDQRVYDNGAKDVVFQDVTAAPDKVTATLIATAKVGPKIEDQQVKDLAKGKRYGEIQQSLETIKGVDSVDVKFFPFWLNTVPSDDKRIVIEFKLND